MRIPICLPMRRILLSIYISTLALTGCGQNNSKSVSQERPIGSREFTLDASKPHVQVSIFGLYMGTYDELTVIGFLTSSKENGRIADYRRLNTGIEGGGTFCVDLLDATKDSVLEGLKTLPTDIHDSFYTVVSSDSCN